MRLHRKQEVEARIRRQENLILTKLVLINSFNGLAIGLTGPLISYWFALRFGVGPSAIAPVMGATFVITGVFSLLTGWLTGRVGIVTSVVWERLIGTGLLALLPLMPSFWLASLVFVLRTVFYRGSAGAQQALTVGLVRDERRGFATSLNAVSFQIPRSAGPSISGYLLDAGQFSSPFYAAALLQLIYLLWYRQTFPKYEPPRKTMTPMPPEEERSDNILPQDRYQRNLKYMFPAAKIRVSTD
jgi:MFS family permease